MRRRVLAVVALLLLAGIVLSGCSLLRTPPSVDFIASSVEGPAPLVVAFDPLVEGAAISFAWAFGDGVTSTEENPLHVYTEAGTYSVMLTVEFSDREPIILVKKRFVTVGQALLGARPSYLYWITERGGSIKRGTPTGGESEKLASQSFIPVNMEIGCGKIFWVTNHWDSGTIDYMDLDGSNWHTDWGEYNHLGDVAIDVGNEKIYWTCEPLPADSLYGKQDGALKRANLDFTDVEVLMVYPAGSRAYPGQVVVDSESEHVYWSQTERTGGHSLTTIMASSTRDFMPFDVMPVVGPPRAMVLDTLPEFGARNLYYSVGTDLRRASLDGTSDVSVLSEYWYPWGIALDPYTGRIYFGAFDGVYFTDDGQEVNVVYDNQGPVRSVVLVR